MCTAPISPKDFRLGIRRWRKEARELIITNQEQVKARFDAHHRPSRPYERGKLVLVSRRIQSKGKTKIFLKRFIGPFQIVKQKCENTYLVEDVPALQKRRIQRRFNAHVSQLQPFRTPAETEWLPELSFNDHNEGDSTDDGPPTDAFIVNPLYEPPVIMGDTQPTLGPPSHPPYITRSGRAVKPNIRPLFR